MAINQDADTSGVEVTVSFTEPASRCMPPNVLEAFRTANWRVTLPVPDATQEVMRASTLPDNIARVDSQGAIYVPGLTIVEAQEQSVTLLSTTGPGIPVEISVSVPGITALTNVLDNINWSVTPLGAQVRLGPPRIVANRYIRDIIRLEGVAGPPYPEVVVRMFGRLIVIPGPSTS